MARSEIEIVENAGRLAATLQAGDVKSKNAFLSVVATFISDPSGDIARLRRMMALLNDGSGGHLKRGAGFGEQARVVIREVGRLLDRGEWGSDELKSLFGWTARLLQVRLQPDREEPPGPRGGRAPDPRGPRRPAGSPRPPRRGTRPVAEPAPAPQPPKPLGGLSGKNLEVLKSFKHPKPDDEKS